MAAAATEITRSQAFESFYTEKGKGQRFSPEFINSLVQTMQIPDGLICRDEQAWAWTRWRTWGNSSETAMSSWHSSAWELDQVDCALDLHWFQTGHTLKWIEDRTREERKAARNLPAVRKRRSSLSRAFLKVEARAQVDLSRGRIYALTSPTFSPQVVEKLEMLSAAREQIRKNPRFVHFLTISGARELLDEVERKRNAYQEARQLLRPWEKEFLAAERRGDPILIPEKECKEIHSGGESEEYVHLEEPPPESFSPEYTPEDQIGMCIQEYMARMNPGTSVEWPDSVIVGDILRILDKAAKTIHDLRLLLDTLWRKGRKPKSYAWIRKVVTDEWGDAYASACT